MTQRLTLTDADGVVLAQAEGEDPELVHDLPAGDYTLQAEQLDGAGQVELRPDLPESGRAPDGTTWATYLGTAIAEWIDTPPQQARSPRYAFREWDAAGRPER